MKRATFLCPVFAALIFTSSWATIINVPADYATIQAGIDNANMHDTVLVMNGNYNENINYLSKHITVASGFIFSNDSLDIISTVINGITALPVVYMSYCESGTGLIGFTITGGSAERGGGIYSRGSNSLISHNRIIGNSTINNEGLGGGIYTEFELIFIENNIIADNSAYNGGGIYCNGSSANISHNQIISNTASFGGGINCSNGAVPLITDNVIRSNVASGGGGISCNSYSDPIISENVIAENTATATGAAGGGIHVYSESRPVISNNQIIGNRASNSTRDGGNGGGIAWSVSMPQIDGNIIRDNSATRSGGGIFCFIGGFLGSITNNIIIENYAYQSGAGIFCDLISSPVVRSNTIANNISTIYGGVLFYDSLSIPAANNLIWYNSFPQVYSKPGTIVYSNIEGGWAGNGNINAIPAFTDPQNGIYNVCSGSPCIDTGDPAISDPDGSRSDIGVYFQSHPDCPAIGRVLNVSPTGSDSTGDGSIVNPFRTIVHTIENSRHHDTVIVQPGTYTENIEIGSRRLTFGSNYIFSQDTLDIQNTIIDGDSAGPVLTLEEIDSLVMITGFTIQDGQGAGIVCVNSNPGIKGNIIKNNHGSGIKCTNSKPQILNNYIYGNITDSSGGGISLYDRSHAVIRENIINGNNALFGGGLYSNRSNPLLEINDIVSNSSVRDGGGIYFYRVTINSKLENNILSNNIAGGYGGAIYCTESSPHFTANNVYGNMAVKGGGIYFRSSDGFIRENHIHNNSADSAGGGIALKAVWPYITLNAIDSNYSGGYGGGINFEDYSGQTDSNTIAYNHAAKNGGAISAYNSSFSLRANTICFNRADSSGGGVWLSNRNANTLVQYDTITNNYAGLDGGGLAIRNAKFSIKNSIITENTALRSGGGIYCDHFVPKSYINDNLISLNRSDSVGGGLAFYSSWPQLSRNIIYQNQSVRGGGIYSCLANPTILNCITVNNLADSLGGGLYCDSFSTPVIRNTIFWADSAGQSSEIFVDSTSIPSISYSDIQGGYQGIGNISLNPLFRDTTNGDFHLMARACGDSADSPCIDAGSPSDLDSLLSCFWGIGTNRSDIGAFGGGNWIPVGIEDEPVELPKQLSLCQNYPNPFNPSTTIAYELPTSCQVRLEVFDLLGRRVTMLEDGDKPAGRHQTVWNAGEVSSGIYFYRLVAGERTEIKKMTLLR